MKEAKFAVIGGQYRYYDYGTAPTLLGAKRLASRNVEYWDNFGGWHTPKIYRIEDTVVVWDNFYGCDVRVPTAECVCSKTHGTWKE